MYLQTFTSFYLKRI